MDATPEGGMIIWLVSNFEQTPVDPAKSSRFQCIAELALRRDHSVTYFSSTFKHNVKQQRYKGTTIVPISDKYSVIFVKSLSYSGNVSFKRLFTHYLFSKAMVKEFSRHPLPDAIMMTFPPISLAYEVTRWARQKGVPIIVDIIDPWPEPFRKKLSAFPQLLQKLSLLPLTWKLKHIFSKANVVTAISNQYLEWARSKGAVKQGECFYPARQFGQMQETLQKMSEQHVRDTEKLRVIYAGSFASSYDIPTILKACETLNQRYGNKIEFVIAGSGPQEELIKDYQGRLSNLRYLGRLSKEDLIREYFFSDLGLTQHVSGATQSVTYKLFDLLACGIPILNSLESEMKDIILKNKVGMFNAPGDFEQLARNIEFFYEDRSMLAEYRKNSLELTARSGDADIVYNKVVDLIESLSK